MQSFFPEEKVSDCMTASHFLKKSVKSNEHQRTFSGKTYTKLICVGSVVSNRYIDLRSLLKIITECRRHEVIIFNNDR